MNRDHIKRAHVYEAVVTLTRSKGDGGALTSGEQTALLGCLQEAASEFARDRDFALIGPMMRTHVHKADFATARLVREEGKLFLDVQCSECEEWGECEVTGKGMVFAW